MSILTALNDIQLAFKKYYSSQFWMKSKELMAEREELLDEDGIIFTKPLIELVKPYPAEVSIDDICNELNVPVAIGHELLEVVFGKKFKLRKHQSDSIIHSLKMSSNILVTTGTSSGKTECFLLPLIARMILEKHETGTTGER